MWTAPAQPLSHLSQIFGTGLGLQMASCLNAITIDTSQANRVPTISWTHNESPHTAPVHRAHEHGFMGFVTDFYKLAGPVRADSERAIRAKDNVQTKYEVGSGDKFDTFPLLQLTETVAHRHHDSLREIVGMGYCGGGYGRAIYKMLTLIAVRNNLQMNVTSTQTTLKVKRFNANARHARALYAELMQVASQILNLQEGASVLMKRQVSSGQIIGDVTSSPKERYGVGDFDLDRIPLILGGVKFGSIDVIDPLILEIELANNQVITKAGLEPVVAAMIKHLQPCMGNGYWSSR